MRIIKKKSDKLKLAQIIELFAMLMKVIIISSLINICKNYSFK